MKIVIVIIIIIFFVGLNLYIRISTLKYYKELIAKRIQFSFNDLFNNIKWSNITENKYPQDKELLNRFRKHILITGSVFVLSIMIVIMMLFILRNNI
jgi:ABC-type glycerol-3-phosphate transport system permease component